MGQMGQIMKLTSFGVEQNLKNKQYRIYFLADTLKLFLGEEILTENSDKALETDDFSFAFDELKKLMNDEDFMEHLEACIAFGGDD